MLTHYVGRPSPLWYAGRLTEHLRKDAPADKGAKVYFKRDELNHTGAHKINAVLGQILLAKRMGKTRIIAETGAGQHGVATATACALFDLPCTVFMGATDVERQQPNVFRMKLLGAEVRPVTAGAGTLKDAMNEALRYWVGNVDDTYYCIGTVAGPHPYPQMVRDFQSVIGTEAKAQMQEAEGRLPDALVAAIGGGSNAMGLFYPSSTTPRSRCSASRPPAAACTPRSTPRASRRAAPACCTATACTCCRTRTARCRRRIRSARVSTIPASGRSIPGCTKLGRVQYVGATDDEALAAFQLCSKLEGIIPALEPAHALAEVIKRAPTMPRESILLMNLCGRGDKDIFTVARHLGVEM
ncbi:tryptophan synthase subunit beta [Dankookia sp. P2]|uniref:tryptophan synthase subunit beta n=1 Tax=Dankookia sp. P2 TaxID=3423955 RepID=UPI003D678DCD